MIDFGKANIKEKWSILLIKAKILGSYLQQKPIILFAVIAFILLLLFFLIGSSEQMPQQHPLLTSSVPFEPDNQDMTGVKESVDPRDVWTARIEDRIQKTKDEVDAERSISEQKSADEMARLAEEVDALKQSLYLQKQELEKRKAEQDISKVQQNGEVVTANPVKATQIKTLGTFKKDYGTGKKGVEDYIPSGTFVRAVLMMGAVVGTGSNSASNPDPIMLRLTDGGIFSKNLRTYQIKEAILIGDCSGDLSSERAKCRLQTLSLRNRNDEIIEKPIKGWVVGEDARYGIKGHIVDRSSDMIRIAMLNGILSSMSNFFQSQTTKGVFPISPITGQQNSLSSANMLKGGAYAGASDAFSKMADFVMERFNSMSPQIVIEAGREVDVVFKEGVDLLEIGVSVSANQISSAIETNKHNDGNLNNYQSNSQNVIQSQNFDNKFDMKNFARDLETLNNSNNRVGQNQEGDIDGF
jgi:conjugal transfer pilus assembly protein TraB